MATEKPDGMLDVLEILKDQHTDVDLLIAQLATDDENREEVFARLADMIEAHATVEEQIFYPGVLRAETEDILRESVEEHLAIKRVLADMLALDPEDDATFKAKLGVLKDSFTHHAHDEEEGELFPILEDILDEDERDMLGNEVLALFEELMEQEPRQFVPQETGAAATLPTL